MMQEDFNLRQSKLIESRLFICRQWLVLALVYYILKSSIITYPLLIRKFKKELNKDGYEDGEGYDPTVEFMQTGICFIILVLLVRTYFGKKDLKPIRWLLILQAFQMILSNMNRFQSKVKADDDEIGFRNY